MELRSACLLTFLIILTFMLSLNSFSEQDGNKQQSPDIKIQEAQEKNDTPQIPPIEVQVKDNKTQQTSTLAINPNERLFRELQEMRLSLQQIQQTLDYLVNHVIADLEAENQQLKATLQNYGINPIPQDTNQNPSSKYIPGSPIKDNLPSSIPLPQMDIKQEKVSTTTPQEFYFKILEEWGRNPEVVKQMNANAPTIKGIIGVVPYGSPKEKLQELAHELRLKYDEYDNINIEIFDDETSAKEYIEKNIKNQDHNVLSISKHKESGRDIITIYGINDPNILTPSNN